MIRTILLSLLTIVLFTSFVLLGTWQLERRAWKLDLIARVDSQLVRAPVLAPARDQWSQVNQINAYLPVKTRGTYLHGRETLVQAMTVLGSGYWVITPLQQIDGSVVLINRGFVDAVHQTPDSRPDAQYEGAVDVEGLLRLTEPGGRFLRPNQPEEGRWYSRDVAGIGDALNLPVENLAPYFIDASASSNSSEWPVAGLTVVKFRNSHLMYAITWFTLALMTLVGAWIVLQNHQSKDPFDG